jgi:hypothetical protein
MSKITKNVLLNYNSSTKEKIEKDSDDFRHRKLNLKVKVWHFLTPPTPTIAEIICVKNVGAILVCGFFMK